MTGSISKLAELTRTQATWRDYFELCKPRVVALMILTSIVGMCLAEPGFIPLKIFLLGNLGIALAAFSAAVINHLIDRHIDILMQRTQRRPVAQGKISPKNALIFGVILCALSMIILISFVNVLTAILTFITLIGYAGVYTIYLKHATPQNIVIGGLAGAAPPLLGWVAVTGHIEIGGLLLMLIIFIWTPPHFWALAIHRFDDYAKAKIPMLPNTHGIPHTKKQIFIYTWVLFVITMLPFFMGKLSYIYLVSAILLNARFIYVTFLLLKTSRSDLPMKTFRYSIFYLMILFAAMLLDHYLLC